VPIICDYYRKAKETNMINVAIDGPAGAGKSTISKGAAKELGFIYVDTGALYRTIALSAVRNGIIDDKDAIIKMLESIDVKLGFENGTQCVYLNGEEVSAYIRTPEISMGASKVSAIPKVREFLLDLQRDIAKNNNVIMDGRDIGTVVLPKAECKIFLTASAECRAQRRYKELVEKGENVKYEDVLSDVNERDYNDSHREIAPLKPSKESVIADTSELTLDESIALIVKIIKEHM
jgi:cytidylate kinase